MPRQTSSLAVYEEIGADLARREGLVLDGLEAYHRRRYAWPTAYELFTWMRLEGFDVADLNSVRPRLTALREAHRVWNPGKRPCTVTGKLALVWQISDGRLF